MKLVTTVHGWVVHTAKTPLYYGIERAFLRCFDEVLCVSEDLYNRCLDMGIRPDRCQLIHNAIDTEQFSRLLSHDEAKSRLAGPTSGVLLGAMGRLSSEKGFDLLIQAVARLVEAGQDVQLWIAGDGPDRRKLESEIEKHSLNHRIKLLGLLTDPREFFQGIDLFVLSSVREGLPNVLLEAMAMETPVVATRVAGIPGLLQHGDCGVLVEPGKPDALATGIHSLITDSALRRRLAIAARHRIEQDYSFERRMQRVAAVYDRVLSRTVASQDHQQRRSA
jgi:glycosyltransferase involved in cell wall biosynthesis